MKTETWMIMICVGLMIMCTYALKYVMELEGLL